jgi:hypothetical protein
MCVTGEVTLICRNPARLIKNPKIPVIKVPVIKMYRKWSETSKSVELRIKDESLAVKSLCAIGSSPEIRSSGIIAMTLSKLLYQTSSIVLPWTTSKLDLQEKG